MVLDSPVIVFFDFLIRVVFNRLGSGFQRPQQHDFLWSYALG